MTTYRINQPQSREDVHVGIVCTLDVEKQAIDKFFEEVYNAADLGKLRGDANYYKIGRIGRHNVVLVKLSGKGTQYSSRSVADLSHSYPDIKLFLLVGICAGVPFRRRGRDENVETTETILGDVMISDSIVQTDSGKQFPDEFRRRTDRREVLGNPPLDIRNMLTYLRSETEPLHEGMVHNLNSIQKQDQGKWEYKGISQDRLFQSSVRHKHYAPHITCECMHCRTNKDPVCHAALQDPCTATGCAEHLIQRTRLKSTVGNAHFIPKPSIHFGTFASANTVMKSGEHRDKIVEKERTERDEDIIAFEMEGAGMWDDRPCVIIKGVSDYADSHKNDIWHAYAAATAASCTKAFLEMWIPSDPLQGSQPQRGQSVSQGQHQGEARHLSDPPPYGRTF
jgi:nucleoside phosphorylase